MVVVSGGRVTAPPDSKSQFGWPAWGYQDEHAGLRLEFLHHSGQK